MSERNILQAGIHLGIPMSDYIADPAPEPSLSKGVIHDLVIRSPLHAHSNHPRFGKRDDDVTARSDLGSACHSQLLGGPEIEYVNVRNRAGDVVANWQSKAAQGARDEIRAVGRIPLLARQEESVESMAAIARPLLASFGDGDTEATIVWQEECGSWGRCRPDFLAGDRLVVVDYKTSTNADPLTWIRTTLRGGKYGLQGTWNLRALRNLLGPAAREFVFLVQEIDPPYAISKIRLGEERIELETRKIVAGLRRWRRAMDSGKWPGYDDRIHDEEMALFETYDWENRAAAYADQDGGAA